eukprot:27895-Eustigmatos_ZCMA.PRE.1
MYTCDCVQASGMRWQIEVRHSGGRKTPELILSVPDKVRRIPLFSCGAVRPRKRPSHCWGYVCEFSAIQ